VKGEGQATGRLGDVRWGLSKTQKKEKNDGEQKTYGAHTTNEYN